MKNIKAFIVIAFLLFIPVMVLTACSGEKTETSTLSSVTGVSNQVTTTTNTTYTSLATGTQSLATNTSQSSSTQSITGTTTFGDDIGSILSKASAIPSIKYDMEVNSPGATSITSTFWVKGQKMRIEAIIDGNTNIMLIDGAVETIVTYIPSENVAMKMDFGIAPQSVADDIQTIMDKKPQITCTETIDGKLCIVIQYSEDTGSAKAWVWKEYGLPIKTEVTTPQGTAVMQMTNFDFSSIPDNMFELPPGIELTDMGSFMPPGVPTNIPDMPQGFPTDIPNIPSF